MKTLKDLDVDGKRVFIRCDFNVPKDEFGNNVVFDKPFLLAMANSGPKTNGSQFFITLAPTGWLNGKHTIFGEVISGEETVRKMENVSVSRGSNKPLFDQVIKKAYIK